MKIIEVASSSNYHTIITDNEKNFIYRMSRDSGDWQVFHSKSLTWKTPSNTKVEKLEKHLKKSFGLKSCC